VFAKSKEKTFLSHYLKGVLFCQVLLTKHPETRGKI